MIALPPGFSLRRVALADLAPFGAFSRQTFIDTYAPFQAPDRLARHVGDRFDEGRLADELADPARTVLALMNGSEWAGYAMLRGGAAPPDVTSTRPVEVERFYVGTRWHGQGVAGPLMSAGLDAARQGGHDVAWLGVWERNPRAIRFYEKQGFRIVGRQVYLFGDQPEDDHVMAREL